MSYKMTVDIEFSEKEIDKILMILDIRLGWVPHQAELYWALYEYLKVAATLKVHHCEHSESYNVLTNHFNTKFPERIKRC